MPAPGRRPHRCSGCRDGCRRGSLPARASSGRICRHAALHELGASALDLRQGGKRRRAIADISTDASRGDGDFRQVDGVEQRLVGSRRKPSGPGAASRLEPMILSARASSSAPVTTRRSSRMRFHFSISAGIGPFLGRGEEVVEMHALVHAEARGPGLFHGEAEDGREPGDDAAEDLVDHGARGAAARAGPRRRNRERPCGCRNRRPTGRWCRN